MAENLKVLRRRIRSVVNVGKITRAMEMVAAAKLRRAQGVLRAGQPYALKLQALLSRLAGSASVEGHPLFEKREAKRTTLVLFTADRGLCGSFNSNLVSAVEKFAAERGKQGLELYCVGRKGQAYFARRNWPICGALTDLAGTLDRERSDALAAGLLDRYVKGETDEIVLLHSVFISSSVFRPAFDRFLSLDAEALAKGAGEGPARGGAKREIDYIFEPSAREVLDSLLPRYLQSKIYITLAEQFTSEHSARMLAMNSATTNCQEMMGSLTLKMNKARQSSITKELLDIVGGAEALKA